MGARQTRSPTPCSCPSPRPAPASSRGAATTTGCCAARTGGGSPSVRSRCSARPTGAGMAEPDRQPVPWAVDPAGTVAVERYYDRDFAALEGEHLWRRAWQMACRLEELPTPGDYVEYTICDQVVLLVATDEDTVRGYHNACRHRATQLATGSGSFGAA